MVIGILGPKNQAQHIMNLLRKNKIEYIDLSYYFKNPNLLIRYKNRYKNYINAVRKVDVVYGIGQAFRLNPKLILARLLRKPVINHWIGSDVLAARKNKMHRINQLFINTNLSCSMLIKDEIMEMGINSKLLPIIPSGMRYDVAKMPEEHSVLVYMPEGNELFYGKKYVEYLAREFPTVRFLIVANSNKELINLENVSFLGRLSLEEMESLYDEISILLRLPEHDGLSLMLLEALAKGKQVIYKYKFPYVYTVSEMNDLRKAFEDIIKKTPKINYEANEFIRNNYNEKVILDELMNILKAISRKKHK